MGLFGGGGGGSSTVTQVEIPEYLRSAHESFISTVRNAVSSAIGTSPYSDFPPIPIDVAFFGTGYLLKSFPAIYDMYGKFMAGLDIEALFKQEFKDTTEGSIINNLIDAQATELSDDLENEVIPRYETGMRDINAVLSGTFVVGKAMLERKRMQELSKFGAEVRYKMIPVAVDRWKTILEWNKQMVITYAELIKLYFASAIDVDSHNYEMKAKNALWPFTVLDFERAAIGAASVGGNTRTEVAGASTAQRIVGGALSGVAMGSMAAGSIAGLSTTAGAVGGGLLGIASALL